MKLYYFFYIGKPKSLSFYIMNISCLLTKEFFKNFLFIIAVQSNSLIRNFDDIPVIVAFGFHRDFRYFRRIFIGIIQTVDERIGNVEFIYFYDVTVGGKFLGYRAVTLCTDEAETFCNFPD